MYSVVGCRECDALKVVEGRPETTECNRCGKRLRFSKLKKFIETENADYARELRASMLANRQGQGEAFAEVDSFAELDAQLDDVGVDDEEYLAGSGIDADEVASAAERADRTGGSRSRKDIVLDALRELDSPTEDDVIAYATEHGVPAEYVSDVLSKLARRGRVSESRGRYRLL